MCLFWYTLCILLHFTGPYGPTLGPYWVQCNFWKREKEPTEELGLIYLPTGNATPDYYCGHRTQAMEKYSKALELNSKLGSKVLALQYQAGIQLAEPAFLYEKDGSLRRFGLGTQKKNYYTYLVFDIYYCYIFIFICIILHIYT